VNHGIVARWADIDALLDALFEQPDELRRSWLERHCEDAELRTMVLSLLAADSMHAAALEARAAAAHEWLSAHATELPEIPGYRVIELIGEGGMASVFLAERRLGETVQRVALKRLRLNVYDPTERRRFEHEHRVLARLEHPNIAHLLDAGIAPDGVPWFAMEYVEGQPLVAWCDSRHLGVDARLALFTDICAAVQHAHQHLVIHRDLKPSNIQVDNDGNVKLLDFGIARLLEPDTDRPDGTRTELRRLTPGYAAPEQYTGHTTTATDIYALGVILVELLTGQKPAGTHASNSDPPRNPAITRTAAHARDSSPRALERLLAGDIGAIARKATRSEPALRYGSAQALAEDLAALRSGRPVAARRGDWRYRAACFIRRNRTVAAASVVITATLVVTTAISLQQAREAREQAAHAQAAQAFVADMLAPLRMGMPATRMPRLDDVLAQGVRDLESRRLQDPAVYSELMMMFAHTYGRMGHTRRSRELAARAYAHSLASFGADDLRTIRALSLRGQTTGESPAGLADLKEALARMRRLGIEGVPLADVLDSLAAVAGSTNRSREAMVLFTEAQRHRERALGSAHPDLAQGYANLGDMERNLGNSSGALAQYERAYRHSVRHEGAETRHAADYLGAIASVKSDLYGWHAAQKEFRTALDLLERIDPDGSPERINLLFEACFKTLTVDDMAQAEIYCNAAVPMAARVWGEGSRMHGAVRRNRVYLLVVQGRLREAREEGVGVRASLEAIPGEVAQVSLQLFHAMYSELHYVEGDYAGMRDALLGLQSSNVGTWTEFLSRLALACEYAPAPECPADLVARADTALPGPGRPWPSTRIVAQLALARLALKRSDTADAHRRLDDIEATAADARLRLPDTHRWMAEMRMLRGDTFAAQGEYEAAVREWRAAEAVFASRYTPEHPFRRQLARHLRSRVSAR
jgi:serine/threonine-protein kinase